MASSVLRKIISAEGLLPFSSVATRKQARGSAMALLPMRRLPILLLLLLPTLAPEQAGKGYVPPQGFVPDSATAVRIAVAVWIPIYGAQQISSEKPFVAKLQNGVWTVTGSLPPAPPGMMMVGGTAVAK